MNKLIYFNEVCKTLSYTKAAQNLYVSQPAIFKAIQSLENELGIVLFKRGDKKVTLTKEGKIFYKKTSVLLTYYQNMIDEMREVGIEQNRIIRIGIPPTLGTVVLPDLATDLGKSVPYRQSIIEESSVKTINMVKNNELDVAMVLFDEYQNTEGIDYVPILNTSLQFCTNKNNPLVQKGIVTFEDLKKEPIILYYPGGLIHKVEEKYNIPIHYVLHSNQVLTIVNYIKSNLASTLQFPEAFQKYDDICCLPLASYIPMQVVIVKKKMPASLGIENSVYSYLCSHAKRYFVK